MPKPLLPPAVRFYLTHVGVGYGLATLFVAALLWADPGGLGQLLRGAPGHPGPLLLLWFFCGLTMGGVQTAVAALLLEDRPKRDDDDDHGGTRAPALVPVPVPVKAR